MSSDLDAGARRPSPMDSGVPPAPGSARAPRTRVATIVIVVLVLVAGTGALLLRQRTATPEQFAAFAQKLDMYGAPSGHTVLSWTPLDPLQPGYNGTPASDWQGGESSGTWTSTHDPASWVAVHGWQARVPVTDVAATCAAVQTWLTGTAATLGLDATSDSPPTAERCRAAVARDLEQKSNVNDAWAGLGMQSDDGTMRYRTGSLIDTAQSDPRHVTFTVIADATRFGS